MAEPDRTNADAERVSDIVARLPRWNFAEDTMEPADDGTYVYFEDVADIIEAQSKALAEARAIIAKYWDGVDMLNDGPDDSDVAYAMGQIGEAHKLAGPIAEAYRASKATPTPENPNG